jgi:hypothetical protein
MVAARPVPKLREHDRGRMLGELIREFEFEEHRART